MAQRVIKKIEPTSLAKVMGVMYALLGVIIGLFFAAFGAIFSSLPLGEEDEAVRNLFGTFFGVGSIIFFPILYGILGLILGILTGLLYNLVAGWVGGIRLEVED